MLLKHADTSEIHDVDLILCYIIRTLWPIGHPYDPQGVLLVPFSAMQGSMRASYMYMNSSSYRIYHQSKTSLDWSHLQQNFFAVSSRLAQCLAHNRCPINRYPMFLESILERGRFHLLGEEKAGRKAKRDRRPVYLAFNLCRMLQLPPATNYFTTLIYTDLLKTEPQLRDTSVNQLKQLSVGKPSWAAVLPLSKDSVNLDMPFFNLITSGAITFCT